MTRASSLSAWIRQIPRAAVAGLMVLATSCAVFGRFPVASGVNYPGGAAKLAAAEQVVAADGRYALSGVVDWPQLPYPQAQKLAVQSVNLNTVVSNAAVALIELGSGVTVGTGVTDSNGNFTINTGGYVPQVGAYFIVEAVKGLNSQLPGNEAPRLRSILEWTGSAWLSITNALAGGQIAIDQLTTSVSLEVSLGNAPASSAIGTVNAGVSPAALTVACLTNGPCSTEINTLAADVKAYILASLDPIGQVDAVTPTLFTVSPTQAAAGQVAVLNGTGFVAGNTTVDFTAVTGGGVAAPILALTPTQIYVQIPNGSATGNVWVVTSRGTSGNVPFGISNGAIVTISSVTPDPVSLGNVITILGTNFVSPASNNGVIFHLSTGATTSVSATSGDSGALAVTVPQTAISGLVYVQNSLGLSNNYYLSVSYTGTPVINPPVFPTEGVANQDVILNGILFGNTPGTVTVTNVSGNAFPATIRYWRDNQVRFTVPWQIVGAPGGSTVKITVYNAAQQAASATWTALAGQVQTGSWAAYGTLPSNSGNNMVPFWSGTNLYIAGGGGGSNIAALSLNSNGGPNTLTGSIGTLPITTNSPDGHGHYNTWLGDRYWIFDMEGSPQKCYIQFDPSGNYVAAVNVSPSFELLNGATFYQHDSSICGGPKGIYISGSDSTPTPVYNNLVYSLFDPSNDTIGPWNSVPLPGDVSDSNAVDYEDNGCAVLQNNLWRFGYDNIASDSLGPTGVGTGTCAGTDCGTDPYYGKGHQMVCPLNADGSPIAANGSADGSPFYFAGPSPLMPTSQHFMGATIPIGPFLYNFDQNCCGVSNTFSTPLVSGTYPQDIGATPWTQVANNITTLPGAYGAEVVGGYVYVVGGAYATTNVIYYAPIQ